MDKERTLFLEGRGKYILIPGDNNLVLFETKLLSDEIINPMTNVKMSSDTILYIMFAMNCHLSTSNITIEYIQKCFEWYSNLRKKGITFKDIRNEHKEKFNIVKYYLTPIDFQEHFRNYNSSDSEAESYERDLAEKALIQSNEIGSWLIRHSSKNRPTNQEELNYLNNLGIRYYAISYLYSNTEIKHILISKYVGVGWKYVENNIYHTFTNFLECLEYVLLSLDLKYGARISVYVSPEFL